MDRKKIIGFLASIGSAIAGALAVNFLMAEIGHPKPRSLTDAEIERELASHPLYLTLKADFPEDYATMLARMKIVLKDRTLDKKGAMIEGAKAVQDVRLKYASYSRRATHDTLVRLIVAHAEILDKIDLVRGHDTCRRFNNEGVAALFPDSNFIQAEMENTAVVVFRAISEGRRAAFDPDRVRDEDSATLRDALLKRGVDPSAMPSNPDCKTTSTILRTIAELPGEGGDRIRAMTAQTLLSNRGV